MYKYRCKYCSHHLVTVDKNSVNYMSARCPKCNRDNEATITSGVVSKRIVDNYIAK